jgi:hypothetical protein
VPGIVAKVWLMESKSGPVAPKKAPRVSWAGGTGPTPKLLPIGAGMVVQPAKVPVSKSPVIMRLPAEVSGAVATSRRPTAKRHLAIEVFIETRSYEQKKI